MYPQSMFWGKTKKNTKVYTCISQFHYMYIKVGFRGFFIACRCFPDEVYTGTHTKNCIQIKKKKLYIHMFVILVV